MNLTIAKAKEFVRARIDELPPDSSEMLNASDDGIDDLNLESTVEKCLEEAITWVHTHAPLSLLEAQSNIYPGDCDVSLNGTTKVATLQAELPVLRLVNLRCGDSDYVITTAVPEDSPVGRMQLNPYTRGTYDAPVLVLSGNDNDFYPQWKYYTVSPSTETAPTFDVNVLLVPEKYRAQGDNRDNDYYFVCDRLCEAVLNYLTGMVLQSYSSQLAQSFFTKVTEYFQVNNS